ncbi:hypothetical protein ACYCAX_11115 [Pseudomonas sp. MT3]|uniref:hypothetical protein n=1 Tax=Pseudomonas sp. ATCC 13867 TaxID=1294143 RepID=UPI0002C4EE25|nr:hypothetical protein [Pseudomonas sp. ATCC 13867]AGI25280.1 hypothetical protein H681_17060 [Pseudomonas sp. ATCC 13867]RFQ19952.1 hypothetical protein D0N87_24900 [Pseudomonas sp. ATCC 13867]
MIADIRTDRIGGQQGFVLVGVIWFLACMTLVVGAAVLWIDRSRETLEAERQGVQRSFEERSMLSRLTWLMATHRLTAAGQTTPESAPADPSEMDPSMLSAGAELPLDGRELCWVNGFCVALIDRASRLSLNSSDPAAINALLLSLGVPAESTARMLRELALYQAAERGTASSLLARRRLRSPMEVFRLPSWQQWEELLVARGWSELVTVGEAGLNLNTASAAVLTQAWRVPEGGLLRLLDLRRERPILSGSDLENILGGYYGDIPPEGWSRLPSSVVLIRIRPRDGEVRHEFQLKLLPNSSSLPPWQFLQRRTLPSHASEIVEPQSPQTLPGLLAAPLVAGPWG